MLTCAQDNASGSIARILDLIAESGCRPLALVAPRFGRGDLLRRVPGSFKRAGSVVRTDGRLLPDNWPDVTDGYALLEGSATSYYCQPYSTAGGIITTEAPITRTVSLPATGSYVLWCKGGAGLSVNVAAGTAAGAGWGTIASGGYLALNITTAGTVTVTPTGAAAGDQVQLTNGIVPTSFIPTPTTSAVTRASSASDTSGNGLQLQLSPAMIASLSAGGKGTICQWVYLPWSPGDLRADSRAIGLFALSNNAYSFLYLATSPNAPCALNIDDDVNYRSLSLSGLASGYYIIIAQYSARISRMRVGLYNPATGVLTWSSPTLAGATPYRGFFPIHASNRLRFFYGGGNLPLGVGPLAWISGAPKDFTLKQIIQEAQRL